MIIYILIYKLLFNTKLIQVGSLGADLTLTQTGYRKYLNWLGKEKLFCFKCGEEIFPGDQIHRCCKVLVMNNLWDQDLSANDHCRFYHAECYDELFIEC